MKSSIFFMFSAWNYSAQAVVIPEGLGEFEIDLLCGLNLWDCGVLYGHYPNRWEKRGTQKVFLSTHNTGNGIQIPDGRWITIRQFDEYVKCGHVREMLPTEDDRLREEDERRKSRY